MTRPDTCRECIRCDVPEYMHADELHRHRYLHAMWVRAAQVSPTPPPAVVAGYWAAAERHRRAYTCDVSGMQSKPAYLMGELIDDYAAYDALHDIYGTTHDEYLQGAIEYADAIHEGATVTQADRYAATWDTGGVTVWVTVDTSGLFCDLYDEDGEEIPPVTSYRFEVEAYTNPCHRGGGDHLLFTASVHTRTTDDDADRVPFLTLDAISDDAYANAEEVAHEFAASVWMSIRQDQDTYPVHDMIAAYTYDHGRPPLFTESGELVPVREAVAA